MPGNLDFSALEPERSTYTGRDSVKYDFEMMVDFGAVIQAKFNKTNKAFQKAKTDLETNPDDEVAAETLEKCMRVMIRIMLPQLPNDELVSLRFGQMTAIMDFWLKENNLKPVPDAPNGVTIEHSVASELTGKPSKKA